MQRFGLALYVILLAPSIAAQEFTPFELEDMVKSAFAGCMKTQLNHPANVGAPRSLLEEYCRCTAHKTAARTTRAEVESFENNQQLANAAAIAKAQEIGRECQREIARQR